MSLSTHSNVGDTDRYIRIAIGSALIIWGALSGSISDNLWAIMLGGLALATALIRICPLWSILKINTLGPKKE